MRLHIAVDWTYDYMAAVSFGAHFHSEVEPVKHIEHTFTVTADETSPSGDEESFGELHP